MLAGFVEIIQNISGWRHSIQEPMDKVDAISVVVIIMGLCSMRNIVILKSIMTQRIMNVPSLATQTVLTSMYGGSVTKIIHSNGQL